MNYEAVYRTAPATPGLLKKTMNAQKRQKKIRKRNTIGLKKA